MRRLALAGFLGLLGCGQVVDLSMAPVVSVATPSEPTPDSVVLDTQQSEAAQLRNTCERMCRLSASSDYASKDYGPLCSGGSVASCLSDCMAMHAKSNADCLACLRSEGPDGRESMGLKLPWALRNTLGLSVNCSEVLGCSVSGPQGICEYDAGDEAAAAACRQQVFPRQTVECVSELSSSGPCLLAC